MVPTRYDDVNEILDAVRAGIRAVLGAELLGLYVYGSVASGNYTPSASDVDMLAVTAGDIRSRLAELEEMHAAIVARLPAWHDRVEVQYIPTGDLSTFKTRRHVILAISPGEPLHEREAGADWTMNWFDVQEHGITLYGPPPGEFIPHVSRDEFVQAVRESAVLMQYPEPGQQFEWPGHFGNPAPTRASLGYVVLTLCRCLWTCTFATHPAKQQAAAWSAGQFPEWAGLIDRALAWRLVQHERNELPQPGEHDEVLSFMRFMQERVSECPRGGPARRA